MSRQQNVHRSGMTHSQNRRDFLALLGAAGVDLVAAGRPQPNILYIMADDHAAHAISAYGSRINQTPNIDRIGNEGVRLANCFCTNSICTPSRASILTGQYSQKNGVYTLGDRLDPKRNHVAKELQRAAYQTAIIGKWHLASDPTGFDYWNVLPGSGAYFDPTFIENGVRKKYNGYCTDLIGDLTLNWLKQRDSKKPFMLMCHHKVPHEPVLPAPKYRDWLNGVRIPEPDNLLDHYEGRARAVAAAKMKVGEDMPQEDLKQPLPKDLRGEALRKWAYQIFYKDYLRCVRSLDDNVGRLLDYLDNENLSSNTIVIYTSDQGFFLGDHGWFDKRLMYEESIRMPFLMRYPGAIRPGFVNRDIILNIDFAPTFLDYAGVKAPADMQGRSFRSNLEGHTPKNWRKAMYYRYWMHNDDDNHAPAHYGLRTERWKLIYYYGKPLGMAGAHGPDSPPEWELFDMQSDPREMHNLYHDPKYAGVVKKLTSELVQRQKEAGDTPA